MSSDYNVYKCLYSSSNSVQMVSISDSVFSFSFNVLQNEAALAVFERSLLLSAAKVSVMIPSLKQKLPFRGSAFVF